MVLSTVLDNVVDPVFLVFLGTTFYQVHTNPPRYLFLVIIFSSKRFTPRIVIPEVQVNGVRVLVFLRISTSMYTGSRSRSRQLVVVRLLGVEIQSPRNRKLFS